MKTKLPFFTLCLILSFQLLFSQSPTLSQKARISVLTCGTGDELYASFGHTAFRVQDPVLGMDVVYNYGTFDFNRPYFFLNFAKGKLIYSLSRKSFEAFLFEYQNERRWVKEQILNLTPTENNTLFKFFENNYSPENRDYLYDPLFNNCSTITATVLKDQFGNEIKFNSPHIKNPLTFRQLVHQHITTNSWGAFGIDLAFGGITDKKATALQYMFLPYKAMEQLKNTTLNGRPIVKRERTILNYPEKSDQGTFMTSPLFWFLLFLCFVMAITLIDKKHDGRNRIIDFLLFFASGISGFIILLLWLASDHIVTQLNFNFLWLLPTNAIVSFYLISKKEIPQWFSKYLWVALGLIGVIFLLWAFKVQVLSWLNIPLLLALVIRYLFLLKKI